MIRLTLPLVALLGGCIIYDTDGKCKHCDEEGPGETGDIDEGNGGGDENDDESAGESAGESGDDTAAETGESAGETGGSSGGDDTGGETGPNTSMKITLEPDTANVGQTLIAHMDADNTEFDWSTIVQVTFYGGVEVLAMDEDGGELDLALRIPQDTPAGSADVLILDDAGQAWFAYDVLEILAQ